MRFSVALSICVAASPVFAFEPGSHGEATEEEGFFVGCFDGEGGRACELHARGGIFMVYPESPSEPKALKALEAFRQGDPVRFTGDILSMGDVTLEFVLNSAAANPDDPLAPLVADLQGEWKADGKLLTVTGTEWGQDDGRSYLISFGTACSDGAERGSQHLSLYEMGGDPFQSTCLQLKSHSKDQILLVNVETGKALTLDR